MVTATAGPGDRICLIDDAAKFWTVVALRSSAGSLLFDRAWIKRLSNFHVWASCWCRASPARRYRRQLPVPRRQQELPAVGAAGGGQNRTVGTLRFGAVTLVFQMHCFVFGTVGSLHLVAGTLLSGLKLPAGSCPREGGG